MNNTFKLIFALCALGFGMILGHFVAESTLSEEPELQSMEAWQTYQDTCCKEPQTQSYYAGDTTISLPVSHKKIITRTIRPAQLVVSPDAVIVVDSTNSVLGVSDVLFVWHGDTCSTSKLPTFLSLFKDTGLSVDLEEIHSHVVFTMTTALVHGDPTAGVKDADEYLKLVWCCGGLDEYIAYCVNHE